MTNWNDPDQRAKQMQWRRDNKDRLNASKRKYSESYPERKKQSQRKYREGNGEKLRKNGRDRYRKKVEWFNKLKEGMCCFECGDRRIYVLEMHHVDPSIKLFEVCMTNVYKHSKESILEELKKVLPLCSNCHAELHYFDRELAKTLKGMR